MLHELGSRWTGQGLLDDPDDVYYLTLEQGTAMAESPEPLQQAVQAGRAAYAAHQSRRWPDIIRYGEEIYRGMEDGTEQPQEDGRWQGVAGSPLVATGNARVIRGPEEFHSLQRGEILVAPSTDPAWTPLFALAGAVVTEVGGILSHGAIVAREYGIPAVMGVRGITEAIQTGQRITVDGNRGLVILET
jgi:pyruvate,water dikinase